MPSGPERLRQDRAPASDAARGHFTASLRWIGVLVAAGTYATGLAGYLRGHADGLGRLVAALTSSDPAAVAGALRGARYDIPGPLTYAWRDGLRSGFAPSDGVLLVSGAVLLPAALAFAVAGLRNRTTWRPSWLHAVGALGPAGAVVLGYVTSVYSGAVPLSSVPLVLDLVLLVGFPAVVLASFLVNRFVLVVPLRRREDVVAS